MRYQAHVQPLETFGYQETKVFSIAATGKAFRNLMDGLYSRKYEAIVREICTNAQDSHIAAGTPARKFLIQLPKILKPIFLVRDYGVGMSHQQVMDRYSVLFDSTKDKSNLENGMLGLGSKSPFAYTDGFTLRCWDGQSVRTYTAFLGEGGVPQISLAGSVPSSEPRGVEVSFAVKREDFGQFETALLRVLKGFAHFPEGTPEDILESLAQQPSRYGDGWAIMPNNWIRGGDKVYALQGCVLYPVEFGRLETNDGDLENISYSLKGTIVLDFPIGSLSFTPGRETLTYDETTVAALQSHWRRFRADIDRLFEENFADCTTDWERRLKIKSANSLPLFSLSKIHLRGREIDRYISKMVPRDIWSGTTVADYPFEIYRNSAGSASLRKVSTSRGYRSNKPTEAVDWLGRPLLFCENPGDLRDWRSRLRHYMAENQTNEFVAFLKEDAPVPFDWSVLGHPPLLDISKMPIPPRAPRERSDFKRFLAVNSYRELEHIREDDLPEDAEYVFVHGTQVVRPHATKPAKDWTRVSSSRSFINNYCLTGADIGKIFFVKMRGNEVYKRFRSLKLYTATLDDYISGLSLREIREYVAVWNRNVFLDLWYSKSHSLLPKESIRSLPRSHPIRRLGRFNRAYDKVADEDRQRYQELMTEDQSHIRELIFSRARAAKMEILTPGGWSGGEHLNPILSRRMTEILECAAALSRVRHSPRRDEIVSDYIRKESKL